MLIIKLSADNLRLLRSAVLGSEAEVRGALDLVLERVAQAEEAKKAGKSVKENDGKRWNWTVARDAMKKVLGDKLRFPPFPTNEYYARIYRAMRGYMLDEEKLTEIAEYAKKNLRPPYSLDFLVCQHERILAGEFNANPKKKLPPHTDMTYVIPKLPDE